MQGSTNRKQSIFRALIFYSHFYAIITLVAQAIINYFFRYRKFQFSPLICKIEKIRFEKLSPFLRVRTIHKTDFQKLKNSTGGSYYSSMPKSWSTPPVDFEKLIKQTQGQNLIGCLSGPEGYKGAVRTLPNFIINARNYFRAFIGNWDFL